MSTNELIAVLAEIAGGVRTGDTLEGSLEFHATMDVGFWDVNAAYRTGNTYGQGGMVLIGVDPGPEQQPEHVPEQGETNEGFVPEDDW